MYVCVCVLVFMGVDHTHRSAVGVFKLCPLNINIMRYSLPIGPSCEYKDDSSCVAVQFLLDNL